MWTLIQRALILYIAMDIAVQCNFVNYVISEIDEVFIKS